MSLPSSAEVPQQLAAATRAWTKLRRMAAYAAFDGWTLTILGALTIVCGGYSSPLGLLISAVLLGTGSFELHSTRQLRRLNPASITYLAYNQVALAGALIAYAIVCLVQNRHGGGMSGEVEQAISQAGGSTSGLNEQVASVMELCYFGLIGIALLVQGGTAVYYFSRRKHLQRYLHETPDWIQQMQRERGEVSL